MIARMTLALLSVASFFTAVIVAPYVMLVVGMSFDAPGAEWGWAHLPVIAFPALLLSLTVAAGWTAISSRTKPLWIVITLLATNLAVLAGMWLSL